ncbi:MAG: hypothetical protein NTV46_04005 [Verrucomicrobia bacterium]|nr:hypothetical protein [Verrucomicrobiota bacterium]
MPACGFADYFKLAIAHTAFSLHNFSCYSPHGRRIHPGKALRGHVPQTALALAIGGGHRVVAPFPVTVRDGKAHIAARPGVNYEG